MKIRELKELNLTPFDYLELLINKGFITVSDAMAKKEKGIL